MRKFSSTFCYRRILERFTFYKSTIYTYTYRERDCRSYVKREKEEKKKQKNKKTVIDEIVEIVSNDRDSW